MRGRIVVVPLYAGLVALGCGSFGITTPDEPIAGSTPDGSTPDGSLSNDGAVTNDAPSDGPPVVDGTAQLESGVDGGSIDESFKCGLQWLCDEFERQTLAGGPWDEPGNTNAGGAITSVVTPLGRGIETTLSNPQSHGWVREIRKLNATGKRALQISMRYSLSATNLTTASETMLAVVILRISGTELARASFQIGSSTGAEVEARCSTCQAQKLAIPGALGGGYHDLSITMTLTANGAAGIGLGFDGVTTQMPFPYPSISADPDVEVRVGADHESRSGTVKMIYEYFALTVSQPL